MGGPAGMLGLAGVPFGKQEEVAFFVGREAGGWVEADFVRFPGSHCLGHFVVDFEDDAFGAIFAVLFFVLAADDGEGVHDIGHGVAGGGKVSDEALMLEAPLFF